ncbi:MAG: CTP synthase [Candidatus Andersenbacteria bacterium CG10_big_fil_rev_8_21_14_0_10_54_11]|uniref:CTP synthase n=1 Tax=Candidatus Andersenbacteria bacterium CG10_big_fil_rev_8_21_14_0_10_54_11 TaxID=1974485 RepID=A0A2M6WZ13_9BACT|nr:MAG: CTP synthase [Candidatus Andersenbacteria bacterium CG10_big_fil_rev_8_21_14_0_10_54_11]
MTATKYIFVTGGVLSGLGKGITAASIANVLKERGVAVNMQKFDQYINVDAGTLNPAEHGEVFVTDDGAETDLDLGHYERFLEQSLTRHSSVMTGAIYQGLIARERKGEFLGKTVQVIPHVTNEVKDRARRAAALDNFDVHIVEIGGTVGDDEGFHFIEAARQMRLDEGRQNVLYVHVVFLPYLKASEEVKTKPAQNSVRDLRSIGIQPDVLIARTDYDVKDDLVSKLSLYTNVEKEAILILPTLPSVYEVPLLMEKRRLDEVIAGKLGLTLKERKPAWPALVEKIKQRKPQLTIALVGKYTTMLDTYASVIEALKAACWQAETDLNLRWIDSEILEEQGPELFLKDAAGIVVPGGFGSRGIEGKITAIQYAREKMIPYLGLCLGMQLAVIEFARNVAGITQATSEEFLTEGETERAPAQRSSAAAERSCVIHIMADQKTITDKGGTMRLGGWDCVLTEGSFSREAYGQPQIRERHRHRYEFNNDFRGKLEKAGLRIAGTTPNGKLVEIVEVANHPWFVGVQYHAEFTSRPTTGHPLFNAFIAAAKKTA